MFPSSGTDLIHSLNLPPVAQHHTEVDSRLEPSASAAKGISMNEAVHLPPSVEPVRERILFAGRRADFRRMVLRGGLLELFTFGFYRFWLTTDMRRHLWSHTSVEGDTFEYTGRARELLIGFLVALAILIPIYLVYFLLGLEAERYQAFASAPLFLFLYLFGHFAMYRARRYRLTRTVWRGVRFWMTGSGWAYAGLAVLWGLATATTLGLALPWRDAALERYKMQHSHYGSVPGRFDGKGWDFFKRGWWIWLLGILVLAVVIALVVVPPILWATSAGRDMLKLSSMEQFIGLMTAVVTLAFLLVLATAPFLYGAFKAVQWKWWVEGIRFGEVKAFSTLRRGRLIGLYWAVIGWSLLFTTIFGMVVSAGIATAMSGFKGDIETIADNPWMIAFSIVGYLLMIIAINMVVRLYLIRDVWQRVVASISLTGLDSVLDIEAKGDLANALGEGFADGLDVGGF
jgi:uncharacterized membrane protein YjgN (DUF898 family)